MTAEANLIVKAENQKPGYIVPFQALLPAPEADRGFAFVYDPGTSTVKKTAVRSRGSEDKEVIVYEGLARRGHYCRGRREFFSRRDESQTVEAIKKGSKVQGSEVQGLRFRVHGSKIGLH